MNAAERRALATANKLHDAPYQRQTNLRWAVGRAVLCTPFRSIGHSAFELRHF
jgi:hypothetical protein